jgi:hypothetical protein
MRKSVSVIKKLLDECTDEDRGEWKSHTQTILSAVRTSHPTRRGVTGAIASGFFENSAFPALAAFGWTLRRGLPEDPFTFAMEKDGRVVRVLIASLQQESGKPRRLDARDQCDPACIVHLAKKTSQILARSSGATRQQGSHPREISEDRAYSFDDFDLLAVNMHAATRRWADFSYTPAARLRSDEDRIGLIASEQLVPLIASRHWTNDLALCLDWLATALKAVWLPPERSGNK